MEATVLANTGYCGVFCGDCIPSRSELFCVARTLKSELAINHLEKYAQIKEQKQEVFKDYNQFLDVLNAIINLECSGSCRKGGCNENCEVRSCAISRELVGCWACDEMEQCEKLSHLKKHHPHLDFHLNIIATEGLLAFHNKRKSHYAWDK
ncbi:MAG TPA: hypothetical protein VMV56_05365 [Williamwhitmania sp.]|nr:hypothetical protein [Williamwhitmania sp.]